MSDTNVFVDLTARWEAGDLAGWEVVNLVTEGLVRNPTASLDCFGGEMRAQLIEEIVRLAQIEQVDETFDVVGETRWPEAPEVRARELEERRRRRVLKRDAARAWLALTDLGSLRQG